MFKSALDGALPVNTICIALIFVIDSLLKTDERRSSVTLWGRSAQSQTPQKSHLPGKSRWRRTLFASVPNGTVCPNGKPKRPSCLISCDGSFWAGSRLSGLRSCKAEAAIQDQDWWQQICENIMIPIFSKYRLTSCLSKVFRSLSKSVVHERY